MKRATPQKKLKTGMSESLSHSHGSRNTAKKKFATTPAEEKKQEKDIVDLKGFKQADLIYRPESGLRKWLKAHGKEHCIDFDDEELRQLRNYFNSLDEDGSEQIGVDELEDPLVALGLVENRAQVQKIMTLVDEDGSGQIEFPEFREIIKSGIGKAGAKDDGTGAISQFFEDLTSGSMRIEGGENMPFSLFISSQRRHKILQSMWSKDEKVKKDGEKVLANYKKQLAEKMARQQNEHGARSRPLTGQSRQSRGSNFSSANHTKNSFVTNSQKKSGKPPLQKQDRIKKVKNEGSGQKNSNALPNISNFDDQPPEADILLQILKQRKQY